MPSRRGFSCFRAPDPAARACIVKYPGRPYQGVIGRMRTVPPRSWLLAVTLGGLALLAAGCLGLSDEATMDREDRSQGEPSGAEDPFDVTDAFPPRDPQPRYSYERDTRQGNVTGVDVGLIHGVGDPQETFDVGRDTVRFDVLVSPKRTSKWRFTLPIASLTWASNPRNARTRAKPRRAWCTGASRTHP